MNKPEAPILKRSTWHIPGMDCPSEEQVIRLKFSGMHDIERLAFDLPARRLHIWHRKEPELLTSALESLNWGARLESSLPANAGELDQAAQKAPERKLLWLVLYINAGFFVIESLTAWISGSTGLFADGLDMLADALVYGMALYASDRSVTASKNVARAAGLLQLVLALLGMAEVMRRFLGTETAPDYALMMFVSALALIGNYTSLRILQRTQSRAAHIRASQIFTSNDILVNIGVIMAGATVWISAQAWPDLLIGSIVFVLVMRGAINILRLS
jgi:Co/Zn/Cd efflux system component